MTASNGIVIKDDDNRLSQYKSNIVLGESFAANDKERKSFEPNKTKNKKKSKNDESDENEEDDGKPKQEEVPPVGFFKMFRYATTKDKTLYFIGFLGAIATGLTTPANSLIFGDLTNSSLHHGHPRMSLMCQLKYLLLQVFRNHNTRAT
ncbi:hypothetical protein ACLKA6_013968 [Drosophila palustris]